jgi:hypothetical protein
MSIRSQSKPAVAAISVQVVLAVVSQKPICVLPAASARFSLFSGRSPVLG